MFYTPDKPESKKFGRTPTIEEMVMELKELSFEQICELPFVVLNGLLRTDFPQNANGEAHKLVYEALQKTVTEEEMQSPLELVLRSDGLMIRVCAKEQATLYADALSLAKKYHLSEDRISHSYCPKHAKEALEEAMAAKQKVRDEIEDLSIFDWDGPVNH